MLVAPPVNGQEPAAEPTRDYAAGSTSRYVATSLPVEPIDYDCEHLPFTVLRRMVATDPEISAALRLIKEAVMADGLQIMAAADREDLAGEIADFCRRQVGDLDTQTMGEGLIEDSLTCGYKIAETTWQLIEQGPDAGRIGLKSVRLLRHEDAAFVVDRFWNILGIEAINENALLPLSKFLVFTPFRKTEDPRGNAWIRPAFNGWNFKQNTWRHFDRFLDRHALPSVSMQPAPNAQARPLKDASGAPTIDATTGRPKTVSPKEDMLQAGLKWVDSRILVTDQGATVDLIETKSEGMVFETTIDLANREIVKAILLQTRATSEAQHGSKADSQTGENLLNTFIWSLKNKLARAIQRQVLRTLVILNWGEEFADLTPALSLGDSDRKDWATDADAVEKLYQKVSESQWDALTTQLGIPARMEGEAHPYESAPNNPAFGQVNGGGQNQ